LLLLAVAMVNK